MWLTEPRYGYRKDGEQWGRGTWLVCSTDLRSRNVNAPLRGCARKVLFRQCGNFMYAHAMVGGMRLHLAGESVDAGIPPHVWKDLAPIPIPLFRGGGYNPELQPWCVANLKPLLARGKHGSVQKYCLQHQVGEWLGERAPDLFWRAPVTTLLRGNEPVYRIVKSGAFYEAPGAPIPEHMRVDEFPPGEWCDSSIQWAVDWLDATTICSYRWHDLHRLLAILECGPNMPFPQPNDG